MNISFVYLKKKLLYIMFYNLYINFGFVDREAYPFFSAKTLQFQSVSVY